MANINGILTELGRITSEVHVLQERQEVIEEYFRYLNNKAEEENKKVFKELRKYKIASFIGYAGFILLLLVISPYI